MSKTFNEFKQENKGGYHLIAAEDVPGFYKKGDSMYGNCDDMIVIDYLYQPLNGIYTVYLKTPKSIYGSGDELMARIFEPATEIRRTDDSLIMKFIHIHKATRDYKNYKVGIAVNDGKYLTDVDDREVANE